MISRCFRAHSKAVVSVPDEAGHSDEKKAAVAAAEVREARFQEREEAGEALVNRDDEAEPLLLRVAEDLHSRRRVTTELRA